MPRCQDARQDHDTPQGQDPSLPELMALIRQCRVCSPHLSHVPNPVVRAESPAARLMVIGQAPGTRVHATGIPWNDPSGERLRDWLGLDPAIFYDQTKVAIMPMGFCYPGKGKGGDLPPRPECAPLWHDRIWSGLSAIELTLLIGRYAQERYLGTKIKRSLTETVQAWRDYLPLGFIPLVHPSPRNRLWLRRNPWFEAEIVPFLRHRIAGMKL